LRADKAGWSARGERHSSQSPAGIEALRRTRCDTAPSVTSAHKASPR
jgi:hypothetical protein